MGRGMLVAWVPLPHKVNGHHAVSGSVHAPRDTKLSAHLFGASGAPSTQQEVPNRTACCLPQVNQT